MRRCILLASVVLTLASARAVAQMPAFGLGAVIGEPTGISGKLWLSRRSAFDAVVGFSFARETALHLQLDYLFHIYDVIDPASGVAAIYIGVGARVKTENETRFGLRVPVGVDYIFEDVPMDIFFEVAPILDVVPDASFRFNVAIGFRFFIPWDVPTEF